MCSHKTNTAPSNPMVDIRIFDILVTIVITSHLFECYEDKSISGIRKGKHEIFFNIKGARKHLDIHLSNREYVVSLYVLNLPVRNNKNSQCPS